MHTCEIMIRQSQADRKPIAYKPYEVDLLHHSRWKQSVPRLHFSETTMNNQRKNGRPNLDQKYFLLVVALNAVVPSSSEHGQLERCRVMAYASDKVIVRASTPGQFDNGDAEVHWQKGPDNGIYHIGPVGINTDKQLGSLTVKGNIHCFGDIVHPSDARLKENIRPVDGPTALERLKNIDFCKYDIKSEIAEEWGLPDEESRSIVGVIAQKVQPIIPGAVKDCGAYLTVIHSRLFMESAIATKELCNLTSEIEGRVNTVEKLYDWLVKRIFKRGLPSATSNLSLNKSASVCGSYVSSSKSTVGKPDDTHGREKSSSNAKSDKNKNGYKYQHCHITGRFPYDQSLCNNGIIASIVVILLLVMSFCVVAMATLFILDWRNRHSYGLPYPAMFPKQTDIGIGQNKASSGQGTKRPEDSMGLMSIIQKTHSQTATASSGHKRPGIPPPLHSCNHLRCEKYCCDDYTFSQIFDGHNSKNDGERFIVVAKNVRPLGKKYRFPRRAVVDISNNKPTSINHKLTYDVSRSSNTSVLDELMIRPVVRVLGSDNVTLDNRYCMSDDCSDAIRGNYSFFIPISSYMPHIPLDVKFDIGPFDYAMLCNQRPGPLCYGIDASVLAQKI
uniref:Peptidase S74 domain-containing protein n=1 Tax=Romanomermis culicivorax TaxID=13658 RepID=A0A915JRQ7_ROMCU